jgi:FkbM family methyltransferase
MASNLSRLIDELVSLLTRGYREQRAQPFKRSLSRLYDIWRTRSPPVTVIAVRQGLKWDLDLNQRIDASIYYEGVFEPSTTALIARLVKPRMTVLDIGANIGYHTLCMAKLVGPHGQVFAFEPVPWAAEKLQRNLSLNEFHNVTVERLALTDHAAPSELLALYASWPVSPGGQDTSLHPIHGGRNTLQSTRVATLDEYVTSHRIDTVNFLKIDVDGYEYKVIRGAREVIGRDKPAMIVELSDYTLREHGDRLDDLIDLFNSLGYSFYSEKTLAMYSGKTALKAEVETAGATNVLCLQGDLHWE